MEIAINLVPELVPTNPLDFDRKKKPMNKQIDKYTENDENKILKKNITQAYNISRKKGCLHYLKS